MAVQKVSSKLEKSNATQGNRDPGPPGKACLSSSVECKSGNCVLVNVLPSDDFLNIFLILLTFSNLFIYLKQPKGIHQQEQGLGT